MIKKDTIVSTTDGRLTLLQWLKKVEYALKNASATAVKGVPQEDGKVVFEIDFADGTSIKSDPFELPEKLPEGITVDDEGNISIYDAVFYKDTSFGFDLPGDIAFGGLEDYNGDPLEIKAISLPAEPDTYSGGLYYCSAINRYMLGFWNNGNRFNGLTIENPGDETAIIKFYPDVALDFDTNGEISNDEGYEIDDFAFDHQVSHAKYQHTVTIKFDNQNTAVLTFTAMSSDDTKVNTLLALSRVFGGRRLTCSGGDDTGGIYAYLDTHPSSPNDYVVGYVNSTGFHTDETLGTLKGTGFTIEDDVFEP